MDAGSLPALLLAAAASAGLAREPPRSAPAQEPSAVAAEITVTATGLPTPLAETPAPVTLLAGDTLERAPALALDDLLRQVPGFTLFRRTGSRTANPTAQGASLRGLGGSAATRALVLADGVPLADPFGGWVHWGRLPRVAVDRVEVVRGGASGLYGTGALAGVVQLLRRPLRPAAVAAEGAAGEQGTASAALFASAARGPWAFGGSADAFTSEGYVPVAAGERGPVDRAAGSRHTAVELTAARDGERGRWFLRGSRFAEARGNGTALQDNATTLVEAVAGADARLLGGDADARLWWTDVTYEQSFTAVAADRASERLTRLQEVPSRVLGTRLGWSGGRGGHTFLAGVEGRRTEGESRELAIFPGGTRAELHGGEQEALAVWVEDVVAVSARWSAAVAVRGDRWRNQPLGAAAGRGESREASAWSPRLSLRWQATPEWSLTGAAYRSFRAPTLNELYRGFRVGDVTTDPNPALGPERLAGGELGAGWDGRGPRRWRLRGALFWMELEDAVANVTVAAGPAGIQRRRENVGLTRSRGFEWELAGDLGKGFSLAASGQLAEAEVVRFAQDPALEGRRLAQVPEGQAALALALTGRVAAASLGARWQGQVWDDDRNELSLGEQLVVDAAASREVAPGAELFVVAENLLDGEYAVGRTPLTTVGSPRLVRLGFRLRRGGR